MITVEKIGQGTYFEDAFKLSFKYDPVTVSKVKELAQRRYLPEERAWEIPAFELPNLVSKVGINNIKSDDSVLGALKTKEVEDRREATQERLRDIKPSIAFDFTTAPLPHQIEAFNYGLERNALLIGDEQGLGKTKESIDITVARKKELCKCLIVCGVNSVKYNWEVEIRTHSKEKSVMIDDRTMDQRVQSLNKWLKSAEYFAIINIESLRNEAMYKECGKLLGTYIDKIPAVKCEKTNAVHTTFNQYGAVTGRFSSSDTVTKINLQNIPSHEKSIRKIFKARDGYKLVGGDFSQIEPRVLAYFSGDEAMQNAYKEGKDLYAIMGSKVYGVPYEDCREFYPDGTVNPEGKHRRTTMKSVLLGIMYERGAQAIGEQFDKSAQWAQKLIDDFYKSFPKVQQLRLKIEKTAEEYGYVTTIKGRKRRLPDMQLSNHDDYRYAEAHRQSLNSVIQGSSADIMKLAMIEIYRDPRYKELDCHMIITVHDELIMEVPEANVKVGAELLVSTMKRVGHSLIQ